MRKKSLAATAVALAATMMLTAMPVCAAGSNYGTTIGGTKTTTFDKYLVMDADANVPNAKFTYAITPGTAKTYSLEDGAKKFEVLAGVDADTVTISNDMDTVTEGYQLVFAPNNTAVDTANDMVKNYTAGTQKYAKQTATLDFTACKFTEPGVYRYVITETGENQGITNDEDFTRIVDVYVNDASTATEKKLTIAGYVLHSSENDTPDITLGDNNGSGGEYAATKSQGFTNLYTTHDLTFRKEVFGNQASHDKYFEFTVKITDAVAGTVYDVDIANANTTVPSNAATLNGYENQANATEITVGTDGTVTTKFYLQHGQEITIQGLADTTKYEVTEVPEDYKSEAAGVAEYTGNVKSDATTGIKADVKTSYLNTRDGVIPTGVIMTVAPFAAITLLGGFGAASIIMKKRKEDEK